MDFLSSSLRTKWGQSNFEFPFTICLGLDGGNHIMNFLSPSALFFNIYEVGEINFINNTGMISS